MTKLARDIMTRNVITVPQSMDLRDLAKLLLEKGISGAPVTDDRGDLVGVVSQTDLIYYSLSRDDELTIRTDFYASARMEGSHIPTGFQIEDTNTGTVEDVMTPVIYAVAEDTPIDRIALMMTREHIHRVIVRDGQQPVGVISALDLLRVLPAVASASA